MLYCKKLLVTQMIKTLILALCTTTISISATATKSPTQKPPTQTSPQIKPTQNTSDFKKHISIFSDIVLERLGDIAGDINAHMDDMHKAHAETEKNLNKKLDAILTYCVNANEEYAVFNRLNDKDYAALVEFCVQKNMSDVAIELINNFLQTKGKNIYIGMMHYFKGLALSHQKKYDLAKTEFLEAYQINPSGQKAAYALYELYNIFIQRDNDPQSAAAIQQKIAQQYPKFIWPQQHSAT